VVRGPQFEKRCRTRYRRFARHNVQYVEDNFATASRLGHSRVFAVDSLQGFCCFLIPSIWALVISENPADCGSDSVVFPCVCDL